MESWLLTNPPLRKLCFFAILPFERAGAKACTLFSISRIPAFPPSHPCHVRVAIGQVHLGSRTIQEDKGFILDIAPECKVGSAGGATCPFGCPCRPATLYVKSCIEGKCRPGDAFPGEGNADREVCKTIPSGYRWGVTTSWSVCWAGPLAIRRTSPLYLPRSVRRRYWSSGGVLRPPQVLRRTLQYFQL